MRTLLLNLMRATPLFKMDSPSSSSSYSGPLQPLVSCINWGMLLMLWLLLLQALVLLRVLSSSPTYPPSASPLNQSSHVGFLHSLRGPVAAQDQGLVHSQNWTQPQSEIQTQSHAEAQAIPEIQSRTKAQNVTHIQNQTHSQEVPQDQILAQAHTEVQSVTPRSPYPSPPPPPPVLLEYERGSCKGRRVYVYDLPPQFHTAILAACARPCEGRCESLCPILANEGLGSPLPPFRRSSLPTAKVHPGSRVSLADKGADKGTGKGTEKGTDKGTDGEEMRGGSASLLEERGRDDKQSRVSGGGEGMSENGTGTGRGGAVRGENAEDEYWAEGYGQEKKVYDFKPWLGTQQNMVGVIFFHRMKNYECRTQNWTEADAFYLPALFGLLTLYSTSPPVDEIETLGDQLGAFLAQQPGFQRRDGADHFFVLGQQMWDFGYGHRHFVAARSTGPGTGTGSGSGAAAEASAGDGGNGGGGGWGSYLFYRSVFSHMTFLSVERFVWEKRSASIPYATAFHPASIEEITEWVNHARAHPRNVLAALMAGSRKDVPIRSAVLEACARDSNRGDPWDPREPTGCLHVDCSKECPQGTCRKVVGRCGEPREVALVYLLSTFCLMPDGDSATRRSIFDALLAGCIPVFFNRESFQRQYFWHTGGRPQDVSLYFDPKLVREGRLDFLKELREVPKEEVVRLRENALSLVPRIVYRDHIRAPEDSSFEDAFDVTLLGLLQHLKSPRSY